jgi:hypothetical protein
VNSSGNLGLGTTTPSYQLDVQGTGRCLSNFTIGNGTSGVSMNLWDITGAAWRVGTGNSNLSFSNGSITSPGVGSFTERVTIEPAGNVGILTTNPLVPLHVNERSILFTRNNYESGLGILWNNSGGSGEVDFVCYFGTAIVNPKQYYFLSRNSSNGGQAFAALYAASYQIGSDRRIKKNIIDCSGNEGLSMIRNLSPKKFEYIEENNYKKTNNPVIGFIAQEINEHIPNAVSLSKNFIPNICQNKSINFFIDGSDEKIEINDLRVIDLDLSLNDILRIDTNLGMISVKIDQFLENSVIAIIIKRDNLIDLLNLELNAFIYGKEVDDFHFMDKTDLIPINTLATKEIDRVLQWHTNHLDVTQEENAEVLYGTSLKSENESLKNRITELENNSLNLIPTPPLTSDSSGNINSYSYDTNYFYICTNPNSWKRIQFDSTSW